jgi:7-cyano-7-deazaguanine synthase
MVHKRNQKAVVLLSGGLDSATVLAVAHSESETVYAMSFDYGQRHFAELSSAQALSQHYGVAEHKIIRLDRSIFAHHALTDTRKAIPDHNPQKSDTSIPTTYVPARNTIFLSHALGWAEQLGAFAIYLGISQVDYAGYPDCREEYLQAFQQLAQLATAEGVLGAGKYQLHAPLLHLSKAETILLGKKHGVPYVLSLSCYNPTFLFACGRCSSCQFRKQGFIEAQVEDPTLYLDKETMLYRRG